MHFRTRVLPAVMRSPQTPFLLSSQPGTIVSTSRSYLSGKGVWWVSLHRKTGYDPREGAGEKKRPRHGLRAFMQGLRVEGAAVPTQALSQQRGILQSSSVLTLPRARVDPQAQEPSSTKLPALPDTIGSAGSQATHTSVPPASNLSMFIPPVSIIH